MCLFFGLSAITVFTQSIEHTCQVGVFEENIKTGKETAKDLGEFTTSFAGKNPRNTLTKTFQIPNTKMFVSVFFNYFAEPSNPKLFPFDEISLSLILGKRPFKNGFDDFDNKSAIKDVLSMALAEFPLKSFEKGGTGRIATVFIESKKITSVKLECKE